VTDGAAAAADPEPSLPDRSLALARAFGGTRDRATSLGLVGAALMAVAFIAAIAIVDRVPSLPAQLAIAVAVAVVGVLVARSELPGPWLRAWEAYSWLGRREMDRFTARTGAGVPTRVADMAAWVDATPSSPVMRLPRSEILAFLGRFDDARRELAEVSADDPETQVEVVGLGQYIDWLEGGELELDGLRSAVEAVAQGSDRHLEGLVMIATAEARERAAAGDPAWFAPLTAVRDALGSAPRRVVWRDTWRPRAVLYFGIGLVGAILASLLAPLL